jgi:hypothetical protein
VPTGYFIRVWRNGVDDAHPLYAGWIRAYAASQAMRIAVDSFNRAHQPDSVVKDESRSSITSRRRRPDLRSAAPSTGPHTPPPSPTRGKIGSQFQYPRGAGHPINSGYIEAIISESRDPTVDALAIERGFSDCNPVLSGHEIDRFFAIRTGHGPSANKPRD